MKTIKSLSAGCFLSLFLAVTVLAGDMPGAGNKPSASNTWSPKLQTETCEPVVDGTGQMSSATFCDEATPNPLTEAMIIAFQFLASVY